MNQPYENDGLPSDGPAAEDLSKHLMCCHAEEDNNIYLQFRLNAAQDGKEPSKVHEQHIDSKCLSKQQLQESSKGNDDVHDVKTTKNNLLDSKSPVSIVSFRLDEVATVISRPPGGPSCETIRKVIAPPSESSLRLHRSNSWSGRENRCLNAICEGDGSTIPSRPKLANFQNSPKHLEKKRRRELSVSEHIQIPTFNDSKFDKTPSYSARFLKKTQHTLDLVKNTLKFSSHRKKNHQFAFEDDSDTDSFGTNDFDSDEILVPAGDCQLDMVEGFPMCAIGGKPPSAVQRPPRTLSHGNAKAAISMSEHIPRSPYVATTITKKEPSASHQLWSVPRHRSNRGSLEEASRPKKEETSPDTDAPNLGKHSPTQKKTKKSLKKNDVLSQSEHVLTTSQRTERTAFEISANSSWGDLTLSLSPTKVSTDGMGTKTLVQPKVKRQTSDASTKSQRNKKKTSQRKIDDMLLDSSSGTAGSPPKDNSKNALLRRASSHRDVTCEASKPSAHDSHRRSSRRSSGGGRLTASPSASELKARVRPSKRNSRDRRENMHRASSLHDLTTPRRRPSSQTSSRRKATSLKAELSPALPRPPPKTPRRSRSRADSMGSKSHDESPSPFRNEPRLTKSPSTPTTTTSSRRSLSHSTRRGTPNSSPRGTTRTTKTRITSEEIRRLVHKSSSPRQSKSECPRCPSSSLSRRRSVDSMRHSGRHSSSEFKIHAP